MSDDKTRDAINRAARAEALLNDELLSSAFATIEAEYVKAWKTWPAKDTDGRERLWHAVNVVGKVRDHLATVLTNGKMAKADLERMTSRQG